jgi:hypothetical protein
MVLSFGGTVAAMVTSLRMNLSYRRKRQNIFDKGIDAESPLSGSLIKKTTNPEQIIEMRERAKRDYDRYKRATIVAVILCMAFAVFVYSALFT